MRWPPFSGTSSAKRIVWPGEPGQFWSLPKKGLLGIEQNQLMQLSWTLMDPDPTIQKQKKILTQKRKPAVMERFDG